MAFLLKLDREEEIWLVPIPLPRCNNANPARAAADCDPVAVLPILLASPNAGTDCRSCCNRLTDDIELIRWVESLFCWLMLLSPTALLLIFLFHSKLPKALLCVLVDAGICLWLLTVGVTPDDEDDNVRELTPKPPLVPVLLFVDTGVARNKANPDCAAVRDADVIPASTLDAESFLLLLLLRCWSKKLATLPRKPPCTLILLLEPLVWFMRSTNVDVEDDDTNAGFELVNDGNVALDVPWPLLFRIFTLAKLEAFRKLVVDLDDFDIIDILILPEQSTMLLTLFILVTAATISRRHWLAFSRATSSSTSNHDPTACSCFKNLLEYIYIKWEIK